jgi:hypothetical protein
MLIAYCWRSGVIEFGTKVPEGCIEIARGKESVVRKAISATARMAHDNKTLLVPGVPEAADDQAAGDALAAHLQWLKKREDRGMRVAMVVQP